MILKKWNKLPDNMRVPEVRKYYDILAKKTFSLILKRLFDIIASFFMLIILSPAFLVISLIIKHDSKGSTFFRQQRVTTYGKIFSIHKFRTMVAGADKLGTLVTVSADKRITKIGKFLRKYRLDELPQLIDVLAGNMSFVGSRPEVIKYVNSYTSEMMATLLLPAGITSETSIRCKDEAALLDASDNTDKTYINEILPEKMEMNLAALKNFSLSSEIATMFRTVFAVFGKSYDSNTAHDKGKNECDEEKGKSITLRTVELSEKALLKEITEIHIATFKGFFLTFMGKGFLYQLYRGYCAHTESALICAISNDGKPLGFLAYSENLSGLYKYLIKHRLIPFAWYSLLAFFRNPKSFFHLIGAFLKPSESDRSEWYVEIASIGVSPDAKKRGIGSLMISEVKEKTDFKRNKYITLETDTLNNEAANLFYQKNGFLLYRTYLTREGRKMNEYRYKPE